MDLLHYSVSECLAQLQDAPVKLTYLAEGNANVIYTIKSSGLTHSAHDDCCVLRLRKDLPFTKPAIEVLSAFKARVVPLFSPDHDHLLLQQALYKLDESTLNQAQSTIKTLERDDKPNRAEKRRNVYLPSLEIEPHGILMPNLNQHKATTLLEFKPKWLTRSSSAPSYAKRCRTCAVNAHRRQQGKSPGRGDSGFCPLALITKDRASLENALRTLSSLAAANSFIQDFIDVVQPALLHLRRLQEENDQVSLSDFLNPEKKDFSLAMAIRDCSVFLVIDTKDPSAPRILTVKFADLDLKTTNGGKVEHWASIEQELLDSGAYLVPDPNCCLKAALQIAPPIKHQT